MIKNFLIIVLTLMLVTSGAFNVKTIKDSKNTILELKREYEDKNINILTCSNHDDVLKEYFRINKLIHGDTDAIIETGEYFNSMTSVDYNANKRVVDRYVAQLNSLKNHVEEYKFILIENQDYFESLGLDVDAELNMLELNMPLYDDYLGSMMDVLEELR